MTRCIRLLRSKWVLWCVGLAEELVFKSFQNVQKLSAYGVIPWQSVAEILRSVKKYSEIGSILIGTDGRTDVLRLKMQIHDKHLIVYF